MKSSLPGAPTLPYVTGPKLTPSAQASGLSGCIAATASGIDFAAAAARAQAAELAKGAGNESIVDKGDVDAALSYEQRRLERGLAWVDTAITAAPLMGILGTVLGIIDSFQLLGTSAAVDPLSLSGGVAKALVTTATGLSIALVALFPFNLLVARTERRMEELERAGRVYLGNGANFRD